MKVIEYGQENSKVIMLLHGGGLSWWNYREEANVLQQSYHVIMPILDGHADSDKSFSSIEDNANEIINYIDEKFNGSVMLIGGLSLGGQILVEMISQRNNICQYAIIESALIIPMKFTHLLIAPMFGLSYGLIQKKWFAKAQFRTLKMQPSLFDDYYCDTCKITKMDMIQFLKANSDYKLKASLSKTSAKTIILVGAKEQTKMRKSAKMLHSLIPDSEMLILNGYYHGEFSINHSDEYVKLIKSLT